MSDTAAQIEDNQRWASAMKLLAVVTAVGLVAVISGGVAAPAFAALKSVIGQALTRRALAAVTGAVWRTVVRTVNGETLESVLWDEGGRLLVRFVREGGRVEEAVLAGVNNSGLSSQRSTQIASAVRSLIAGGNFTVPTIRQEGREYAAVMDAERHLDVAAELISRGLVRLDTSDDQLLNQQPALVRAARDALLADDARGGPAADPSYRARVQQLSARLAVQ